MTTASSNNDDKAVIEKWQRMYGEYRAQRNLVFAKFPIRAQEPQVQYVLRLAREYARVRRSDADTEKLFDNVREVGQRALTFIRGGDTKARMQQYLMNQGYSEMTNIYKVCMPLDAVNCPFPFVTDLKLDLVNGAFTWFHVSAINLAATHAAELDFLAEYVRVQEHPQELWLFSEVLQRREDPYPDEDMAAILTDLRKAEWGHGELPRHEKMIAAVRYIKEQVVDRVSAAKG